MIHLKWVKKGLYRTNNIILCWSILQQAMNAVVTVNLMQRLAHTSSEEDMELKRAAVILEDLTALKSPISQKQSGNGEECKSPPVH